MNLLAFILCNDEKRNRAELISFDRDVISNPIRISFHKDKCVHNSEMGKTDCIWSPADERLRRIEPYTWMAEADF